MFPATCLLVLSVCALTLTAPAPHRTVTYNQTQHGKNNVQADLENILVLVVPSRKFIGSAMDMFDRSKSREVPSHQNKNIPEAPEIATEVIKEQTVEEAKPVAIKEQNLPEPPEPAKPEVKPAAAVATKEEIKPENVPQVPNVSVQPTQDIKKQDQKLIKPQRDQVVNPR
jgi:hypothetical protein